MTYNNSNHRGETIGTDEWDVPEYIFNELYGKRSSYVVVIPVVNEGERIRQQLRKMCIQGISRTIDTVVVDGGSIDGSLDGDLLSSAGIRGLIVKVGPGRLSAQLRCAYAWALKEGYDGIITIDGNGKDSIETIPLFAAALNEGFDYAQASRFIRGGHHKNTPLLRWLAIRFIHSPLLSIAAKRWLTDTTQGYRAYSRRYLLDERTKPFRAIFQRYELLAYLTVRASQIGYRVVEIPTTRVYPLGEKTPTKISGLSGLIDLIVVLSKALFGRYNP